MTQKEQQSTGSPANKNIACNSRSSKVRIIITHRGNNKPRCFSFSHTFSLAFIITIMIAFVSGLVFLGQNHIKQVYATENTTISGTDRALIFFLTNPTGDFNATGTISSLVVSNRTADPEYVLAGDWNVLASNGNITDFSANFTMVSVNGTDRHIHSVTNFSSNVVAPLILDIHGTTFTGESDITTNDNVTWHAVQTTVTIARQDTIKITFNHNTTNNHFQNQPIYGVVFSIQEYKGPVPSQQQ